MSRILNLLNAAKFAFLALALVAVAPLTHAQTTYDFSSSTAEATALQSAMVSTGFQIVFGAIAAVAALALASMGAMFVWSRFKKFTGMGKKI